VKFTFPSHAVEDRGLIRGEQPAEDQIIPLDSTVIARRMQQPETVPE
jgi:hypothetical protein